MSPRRRTIAGGLAAAALGSGVTAALLLGPSPTSASPPSTDVVDTDESEEGTTESEESEAGDELRDALQPLVDGGALTEEEADALVDELLDTVGPRFDVQVGRGFPGSPEVPGFPGFPGGPMNDGPFREHVRVINGEVVAEAIGIDESELREQLRDGATVAEIAEANGVDPQTVIDALVADYTERVTDWVQGDEPAEDEATESEDTEPTEPTEDTEATETTETTSA